MLPTYRLHHARTRLRAKGQSISGISNFLLMQDTRSDPERGILMNHALELKQFSIKVGKKFCARFSDMNHLFEPEVILSRKP